MPSNLVNLIEKQKLLPKLVIQHLITSKYSYQLSSKQTKAQNVHLSNQMKQCSFGLLLKHVPCMATFAATWELTSTLLLSFYAADS